MEKILKPVPRYSFIKSPEKLQIDMIKEYTTHNYQDTRDYIQNIFDNHNDGIGLDYEFYGFIQNYYYIAKMLELSCKAKDLIIVDVGCCVAIQQVFFHWAKAYIGIDRQYIKEIVKPLNPNVSFLVGDFKDIFLEPDLLGKNTVGISSMSLLYPIEPDTLKKFNETFDSKIII